MKYIQNRYLTILDYAVSKFENDKYVSIKELISYLKNLGFKFDSDFKIQQLRDFLLVIFKIDIHQIIDYQKTKENKGELTLKQEISNYFENISITAQSYQNYIEYLELKDAQKTAKEARWLAIGAIAVSVVIPIIISFHPQHVIIDNVSSYSNEIILNIDN